MKRFYSIAVLGLVATALSITPAMAAPPVPVPTVPGGVTLTECGFDVHATRSGKVKFLFLRQGLKVLFPNQRITLTNPDTERKRYLGQCWATSYDTDRYRRDPPLYWP